MYKKISQSTTVDSPSLFITKNRQRLKQYGNNVYLNNNEEFELEIFNPIQNKIKASISINDNHIGDVVIRPGQRAFLERFLNENKKFLFQTYIVENNNPTVDKAIKNNGLVNIKFFHIKKDLFSINDYLQTTTLTTTNNNPFTYTNGSLYNISYSSANTNAVTTDSLNLFSDSSIKRPFTKRNILGDPTNQYLKNEQSKETGTIEKGNTSSQTFNYDNTQFELFHFKEISWQILPQSQKINAIDEIVSYCGECGAKRKKDTHNFCPHCGTKY
jgi:hypothetical protein